MNITVEYLSVRTPAVMEHLESLWESSVRATHDFLTDDNIQDLKSLVRQGLEAIPILCAATDGQGNILGFMGIEENKIEMLFITPEARGLGIGRQLVIHAIESFNTTLVDVNEQNTQAAGFYRHIGFSTFKRSPIDGQGNPFPLLHMELKKA